RTAGSISSSPGAVARTSRSMPPVRSSSTTRCSCRPAIEREARWSGLHRTSLTGCCGRGRISGCISTRRFIRTAFSTGFDGRNEPDASLACVDAASGSVVWRETPEAIYRGSLLAVDGRFLCLGEHGHLLWLDLRPKGYREISRASLFLAPETWGLPVLRRGLLYVTQE